MENNLTEKKSNSQVATKEFENGERACVVETKESISMYSGPLPHPDMLREYAKIVPDAPERILKMAEN